MKRKIVLVCVGAIALAMTAGSAFAVVDPLAQKCSDTLQGKVLGYVNALQKQVKGSIKANLAGKDSKCSGGFACSGGKNHGKVCTTNANCPNDPLVNGGNSVAGQCTVNGAKGIASAILKAKSGIRGVFLGAVPKCTSTHLTQLGFPNSRCPDIGTDPLTKGTKLADCILEGAVGNIRASIFGDVAAEVMGRASAMVVPQDAGVPPGNPSTVCGVTFASVLQIGSSSTNATIAEAGGAAPVKIDGCTGTACTTSGLGIIGNNLTSPTQTFAGTIPICLVTVTKNAGNNTPQSGTINLATGVQTSFAPIESTVHISSGNLCPVCNVTTKTCGPNEKFGPAGNNGGPNIGGKCSNLGGTDTACPPPTNMAAAVVPNPLNLSTAQVTLSAPPNIPAVSENAAGTMCGACDLDDTIGCQNNAQCSAVGACSGANDCCKFETNTGAFGDLVATTVVAKGKEGPYVAQLATTFCTGKSGDGLVDSTQGLPGPVRLTQSQLNAFEYLP